jgi:hypothetical protein
MADSTSPTPAMDPEFEALLFDLKHHRIFPFPMGSDRFDNPYIVAMVKIQSFTHAVTTLLEQTIAPQQGLVSAIRNLYDGLPSFSEQLKFGLWIQNATLKHPLQRTAKQYQWLSVLDMITDIGTDGAVERIVPGAMAALEEWKERVLLPDNLPIDQDENYIFKHKHGLTNVPISSNADIKKLDDCPVCTLPLTPLSFAKAAPCTHVLCKKCFLKWIAQSKETCTCPLCRACLICGNAEYPCKWHRLNRELAPPVPLPTILDACLPEKVGEVLHGIQPEKYFVLREATRQDRARLEILSYWLGEAILQGDDAARQRLAGDEALVAERVREQVVKTLETSQIGRTLSSAIIRVTIT